MARESRERSFKYQRRSAEDVADRANMRGGNFDSIIKQQYKVYKVRDGKNLIRILPPTWKDPKPRHYGYDIFVNYGIGVDKQSYLSLDKMKGEPDPLAEARSEADAEGDDETAKGLVPRQRVAMWVIDRQDEDEGPQVFLCPFTLDKAIANLSRDPDTKSVVMIDDPEEGNDVRFHKEGSGLKTDYDASKIRILPTSPLHKDQGQADDWLNYAAENPLPETLQFYDYDHIAKVFNGRVAKRDEDDEDADEKPRKRTKPAVEENDEPAPRRRRPIEDEDEGDEPPPRKRARPEPEDEEPPFDEDEDEPPPRKRARPEPEPEEDDEPAPRARKRAAIEDEDDEPPPRKRARPEPEDDEEPQESIRERLRARRKRMAEDDEE